MGSEWREVRVEDIKSSTPSALATGPFGSAISSRFFQDSGVPILRGGNLSEDVGIRLVEDDLAFLSPEKASEFKRSIVRRGDLVFTCWGTIGQVGLVDDRSRFPEYVVSNKQMKLTPDPAIADSLFLYYLFSNPEMVAYVRNAGIGSSVPGFNLGQLRQMPILLPPLAEQRRIAGILGALDDKIELNRRMSQTLESMARALFKSWFVDFDPVRAKAEGRDPSVPMSVADLFPESLQDSEIGEIPQGWRVGILGERLVELVSGARPRGGSANDGVPSIGAENVVGLGRYDFQAEKFVPEAFFLRLEGKGAAIRDGDVLLYKDGAQIGRKTYFESGFPHVRCAVNEHVFILRTARREDQRFLFFWLDQGWMTQEIVNLNSNSAQPGINQVGVRGLKLLIPPDDVVVAFDRAVAELTRRLFATRKEAIDLAGLRDAILPKLMSGSLRAADQARTGAA
jgi:type I restriction enzyme S subunit